MTSPTDPITLATMEPMATAGLAVTLAYLALDRFRYRSVIENGASECHKKFLKSEDISGQTELDVWNEILWLIRMPSNGFKPKGFLGGLYRRIFRRHFDIHIVTVLAVFSGFALAAGVAHKLGTWSWLGGAETRAGAILFFYMGVVAVALPLLSMYGGHCCRKWGLKRATFCDGQLMLFEQGRARLVEAPREGGE